jgi:hypothetical protein
MVNGYHFLLRAQLFGQNDRVPDSMAQRVADLFEEGLPRAVRICADGHVDETDAREIEALLQRAHALRDELARNPAQPAAHHARLLVAVDDYGEMLAALKKGEVDSATAYLKEAWRDLRRIVGPPPAETPPVYDRATSRSRYDPQFDAPLSFRVACPNEGCGRLQSCALSPRAATQRFTCARCGRRFLVHAGEVEAFSGPPARRRARLRGLDGASRDAGWSEASGDALEPRKGQLFALIYDDAGRLSLAWDLEAGRGVQVSDPQACFLATAVYEPFAPELEPFRRLRDRIAAHRSGRLAVAAYYACGPLLAGWIARMPRARRAVRAAFEALRHRMKP